jgi:heat-inducible transcriptional repressor
MADELSDRAKDVLKVVVQEFISKGDPVGSSQLTARGDFEVSPATMRAVLADLEELGYLEKPHTSAGRIPTDRGYRFFVDTLLQLRQPQEADRKAIEAGLSSAQAVENRIEVASKMLYQLSHHAAVVLAPRPSQLVVTRIEFVRLRDERVLAVLEGPGGQVQNKLFDVDFVVDQGELVQAANYLNELFKVGVPIEDVRGKILGELESERVQYDQLVAKALKLGAKATDVSSTEQVLIEGTSTFLEQPEFTDDVKRMRLLFKALDDKHKLLQVLDRVQRARELQIFIGAESDFSAQGEVSVIASPYGRGEQVLGTVGVIGPTRMNYQRVIPLVNFTASALSRALEGE